MCILNSPTGLIVLEGKRLLFYFKNKTPAVFFEFTADVIENLEIKDKEKLQISLVNFLKENKIPKKFSTIILSDELSFKKDIANLPVEKIDEEAKKFINEVPFDNTKISSMVRLENQKTVFYGTNKELYESIIESLKKYGIKIKKVIPIIVFGLTKFQEENTEEFLKDKFNSQNYNFISEKNLSKVKNNNLSRILIPIIIFLATLFSILCLYFFLTQNKKNDKIEKEATVITVEPTEKPKIISSSDEKKTPEVDKEKIKIQVLNGSGGNGVASKMSEILKEKGYKEIETGNADNYDYEKTIIKAKENSDNLLKVLTDDLKNDYSLATSSSFLDEDSQFDAEIIVGQK